MSAVRTAGRTLRVLFRPPAEPVLAGGPVHLDAVVELVAGEPAGLVSSSARATGRSRDYTFEAQGPDGTPLADPFATAVEVGGVATVTPLTRDAPVAEEVLLNQFLALESLAAAVPDGGTLELAVRCARRLALGGLTDDDAPAATAVVGIRMRRDDAELARRYRSAAEAVAGESRHTVDRERHLAELFSARNPLAGPALTALAGHPDPAVAAAARAALDALP